MKKLPKTILNQFDDLKAIQPNAEWKRQTKEQLLQELSLSGSVGKPQSFIQTISLYFKESLRQLSLKPLGAIILLAGVIIGPGIATVSAARASLPGDTLYPLKRSLENVELSFAFTDKKRAEIEIDQVANRLTELHRITQEQTPSPERKQKIVLALEELKKDTDTVKKRLETAKQETSSENNEEAVEIAKIIEEKTAGYKEDLKTSVGQLSDEVADDADNIQLALSAVQEVAIDALNIIAENHEEGGEEVSKEELKEGVEEQLTTIKEHIDTLKDKVEDLQEEGTEEESVEEEPVEEEPTDVPEEESTEEEPVEEDEEVAADAPSEEQEDMTSEIEATLDEEIEEQVQFIEELIELEEFRTALDRLSETKEQVDKISQDVRVEEEREETEEVLEEKQKEDPIESEEEEPSEEPTETEDEPTEEVKNEESAENSEESTEE